MNFLAFISLGQIVSRVFLDEKCLVFHPSIPYKIKLPEDIHRNLIYDILIGTVCYQLQHF